ncbi:polysaccharide biosynthesis/export family protein [Methylocella tundrae]|uniref:Sugar transporter n=1 Tax=Methylocella tundrae TaxID=227605 RepID=A0A4U8YYG5_METTU|nr:polysaccharide biosynthesis/export family protein [Methylocella tundrae]WPP05651.1 polysaccharide biosynthesis/export family protein [Methylocella tundrae]VFU08118.1 Sugar transporter [Methylocella tundrae]
MRNDFLNVAGILLSGAALLALTGCGTLLSGSGPSTDDVIAQSTSPGVQRYEIVDINSSVLDILRHRGPDSFLTHFGDYRPSVEPKIGVGDTVSVTIWEAGAGGLFSAPLVSDRFSTGSKSSTIPDQIVGRDGSISVPYAGRIKVAGRTTQEVQGIVEHALAGKAIEPQVLINMPKSVSNSVTVTGEVVNGARVPLSVRGDRVMDVIATAGGIRAPVNETYVQLSRGQETVRVAMSRVSSDPKENIYLRPNDVLTLIRDPQTFIAYGATGKNAEIPFDAEGISLSQALAKAGGLMDFRSDPAGVFIFRFEPESVVRALAPGSTLAAHNRVTPVVYRLNLRDAASLFIAQGFRIQNRDLLYVSNAPITDAEKVMQIVSMISSPALTGLSACAYIKC